MKKIFVDSSVIIEFQKDNVKAVSLLTNYNVEGNIFYINPVVVSEVAYILKKKLNLTIPQISDKLQEFNMLTIDNNTIMQTYDYMHRYNMKPNDAMIAATCKYHQVLNILTLDDDFKQVCSNESITLLV